jgi:hypothetical protein
MPEDELEKEFNKLLELKYSDIASATAADLKKIYATAYLGK